MFFREKKTRTTPVLQLVENRRNSEGKVRQHIVHSLGSCWIPDEFRKAVAIEVSQRMAGYEKLFECNPEVAHWTRLVIERLAEAGKLPEATCREVRHGLREGVPEPVRIGEIEHERSTELGPYLVLLKAWQSLGIDDVLKNRRFSIEQCHTAKLTVFNRLIEPCSENELVAWASTTSLDELLDIRSAAWAEDRFYRISDRLLRHRNVLERHLRQREQSLFRLDRTIVLYDLTNSYFEGGAERNALAARSMNSKEKRTDCPLISVGVVLDGDGFIITHKVFPGNMNDCRTLIDAVDRLRHVVGEGPAPVVVLDGGIATASNLALLRRRGFGYVVNGKRQSRANFAQDFFRTDLFRRISGRDDGTRSPVFVRRIRSGDETIVLCRSDGRRDKEHAIADGAERKLIDGLEQLAARIRRSDPRLKLHEGPACVNRALGRLAARTTRASKFYRIEYDHESRSLSWRRNEDAWRQARNLHGCYQLRTTLELSDQRIWKLYMTLTRVEDAFRMMKAQLGLRPFRHHTEQRCRGHIWITVLAYHLLRWVEYNLELSGYRSTWRSIRRKLQTHCYATVMVPTENGLVHHVRKPGRPDHVQRLVYSLFGIDWKNLPVRKRTYRRS